MCSSLKLKHKKRSTMKPGALDNASMQMQDKTKGTQAKHAERVDWPQ